MRQIVYIISVILLFTACNSSNKTNIKGEIANAKGETVYLKKLLVNGTEIIDSAIIENSNAFKFKIESNAPSFYQIAISNNTFITLLTNPGEKINLNIDKNHFNNYTVEGSVGSEQIQVLNNRLKETKKKLDSLSNLYRQKENDIDFSEISKKINSEYQAILKTQRDSSISFILKNINSFSSIYALYQKISDDTYVLYKNRDIQYVKLVAESLEKKYPQSPHVKAIVADKTKLINNFNTLITQQKLNTYLKNNKQTHSNILEIKLPNIYGDSISLNDNIHNSFVLLSFWASWSSESIKENLKLLKLYKKYHNKGFEIYQVSLDTKKEKWENAILFDELPWINVSDLQGRNSMTTKIYNVQKLPTTFLIRQGEIISRDINLNQLDKKLAIVLN